jgi:hypothetical protein
MTPAAVLPSADGIANQQQMEDGKAQSHEDLLARNASQPDATGYSAAYAGEAGFYTEIIFREAPEGLTSANPLIACGSL